MVDEYGKSFETPRPGHLCDLAGITVTDLACQEGLDLPLLGTANSDLGELRGERIADEIHPSGAEVVATHTKGWRTGLPAITKHQVGKGQVIYVGVHLDQTSIQTVVTWLCELSGISQRFDRPTGLSMYERVGDRHRLLFIINWTDAEQVYEPGSDWCDAFTHEPTAQVNIPARDLRILIAR